MNYCTFYLASEITTSWGGMEEDIRCPFDQPHSKVTWAFADSQAGFALGRKDLLGP